MKIKNYTGHDINIVSQSDGEWVVTKTIPSDGIARVSFETKKVDTIDGIDIFKTVWGQTTGLPSEFRHVCGECGGRVNFDDCEECNRNSNTHEGKDFYEKRSDVLYIVSKIVAEANPHRDDLLIVSETVRDGSTIIGCKGLARLS